MQHNVSLQTRSRCKTDLEGTQKHQACDHEWAFCFQGYFIFICLIFVVFMLFVFLVSHAVLCPLFSGQTPLEIAQSWADPRVLDLVQRKWETLPSLDKKKAGKGGKGKGSGAPKPKRPASAPGEKDGESQVCHPLRSLKSLSM